MRVPNIYCAFTDPFLKKEMPFLNESSLLDF